VPRLDLEAIRASLRAGGTPPLTEGGGARAAVAVLLRSGGSPEGVEILFIRRAEDPRDPWSGHMAFPGGRHDPEDGDDLLATAIRETREELGLSLLDHGEPLGRLPDLPAIARGRAVGMIIRPFVVELRGDPKVEPNHEVAEVIWTPLAPIVRGDRKTTREYVHEGRKLDLPAHRVGEHVVWGLTFQMLESLSLILSGR
jgi:8-oxo-dGTP pyrophosphatase MutT (NUDIX family)